MKDPKNGLRRLLILFLNFVILYGLLRVIIALGERFREPLVYYIGSSAYVLGTTVLLILYFIRNGGTFSSVLPSAEDLPVEWSYEKKTAFLEKRRRGHEEAKKLLYVLLPLIVTLAISYIELFFFT